MGPSAVDMAVRPTVPSADPGMFPLSDDSPAAVPNLPPKEDRGLIGKAVDRLFGSDVDDPLPWTRVGTTIAGSLAGSYAGSMIPGPPVVKGAGIALGGIAGTMAGAAAPETVMEFMEKSGIVEPGFREKSGLNNEQLMTVIEGEGLLDAYTLGGLTAVRGVGRGLISAFTGTTRAGRETAEEAARMNVALMPVQVGERTLPRAFVSVMGRLPWVSGVLQKRAGRQMEQLQTAFEGIPARFGPLATYDQASASILRDVPNFLTDLNSTFRRNYDNVLAQADMRGIHVTPVRTRAVTEQIMAQISKRTPRSATGVATKVTAGDTDLKRFIGQTTRLLFENPNITQQSMRQMDTILSTIDEKMVAYAKGGDVDTLARFERLRNAVMADMTTNAVTRTAANASQPARAAAAAATRELTDQLRQLDSEMSNTVADLIGSATGKKLSLAQSPTGRAVRMTSGVQTDSLARTIMQGNSPAAVTDLARMVTPDTMREISSSVFREALDHARIPETGRLDVGRFAERLGLNDPASLKYAQTRELLNASGGISMENLEQFVKIARVASSVDIPNVSVLLARRGVLGGVKAITNALIPTGLMAGAGGAATGGWGGAALGGLAVIGGSRLISNMISNPKSARALSKVFDQEATQAVRRAALMRSIELGFSETGKAIGEGVYAATGSPIGMDARETMLTMRDYLNELDRQLPAKYHEEYYCRRSTYSS